MHRILPVFAVFIFTLILSSAAQAQFHTGTIAAGIGGAGRAAVDPAESAYLNPAAVAHLQRYYFGGQYHVGDIDSRSDFGRFALQLSDGTPTNLIPGAFSYVQNKINLQSGAKLTQEDYQLTVGGFAFSEIAVGVAVHHLIQKGSVGVGGAKVNEAQTNANIGLLYTPLETLGIGLVGYDLIPNNASAGQIQELNPVYALAANYLAAEILGFRLDLVKPTVGVGDRMDVMAGLETFFRPDFAVRLGTQWRETVGETNITAGLGYKGPRLSVDYSFQKDLRSEGSVRHLVDLWLPL